MTKPTAKNYVTKAEACRRLGIHRPALDKYLARPGAPSPDAAKRYDLSALAAFVAAQGSNTLDTLRDARLEEVRLRCERLRLELDRERKLTVTLVAVNELHGRLATTLRCLLYTKLENEMPPKLAGQDAVTCRQVGRAIADELVGRMARDLEKWLD